MDKVITLLVLSALPQPVTPVVTALRTVIKVEPQTSRIFTGESLRLTCSIPDDQNSVWSYRWFKDSEQLAHTGPHFSLWKAKMKESGKFSCNGVRDALSHNLFTLRSRPVQITVDGGMAILQVHPEPGLVGQNMSMTCRVRGNPPVHEMTLYKDGIEVRTESGFNKQFHLTNLRRKHGGMYSCRASWNVRGRTISVISAGTHVQISEPAMTELPLLKPNHQQPVSPASVPEPSVTPAAQPRTTPTTTTLNTKAPARLQYIQESGEGSAKCSEDSDDFCEESGDFSEGSGDFSEGSGDFSDGSGDLTQDFDDRP